MLYSFDSEAERQVFEKIAPKLEAEGYQFLDASEVRVPAGNRGYIPDFVAQRGSEFVAIEVKARRTRAIEKSLDSLRRMIEEDKNWKFLVYYADEEIESPGIRAVDKEFLRKTVTDIRSAQAQGHNSAAFLLAWGALEAAARHVHKRIFLKPQTPGRIITVLAERGIFTPNQANQLRALVLKRNRIIHGGLDEVVHSSDIDCLTSAISELLMEH